MRSDPHPVPATLARVRAIAADLSGFDEDELSPTATFMELGFDSLFLTQLSQAYQRAFGVEVSFRQLVESTPTLESLARSLDPRVPVLAAVPPPAEAAAPQASVPPAAAPAPAPASAEGARRLVPAGERGPMLDLMERQLQVMAEQLAMLGARSAGQVAPPASAPAEPARSAPEPAPQAALAASPPPPTVEEAEPVLRSVLPAAPRQVGLRDASELNRRQGAHLAALIDRTLARTGASRRHTAQHRRHHADPRTAAGFHPLWKELCYPLVVERSQGAWLWDLDGHGYVDMLNGFGPNIFGHRAPFVVEAIQAQLDRGFEIGPQTPLAGEAARLVCELTGQDRASFVCTGSEAVQAALRCARTFTGRDTVVTFAGDYHGNFDEVLYRGTAGRKRRTLPAAPGVPRSAVSNLVVLEYGEEASLDVIRELGDSVAAVMVEPVQSRRPEFQPGEFLRALRELTEAQGSLLIFDEVVTGFRSHPGGAQAVFGVRADLATYGKVLGGGMPVGVVAGRKDVMDTFDGGHFEYGDDSAPTAGVTFFAGTFVRHPLAMAATLACLQRMKDEGPALQEGLTVRTEELCRRLNALFVEHGAPFELPHFTSVMYLRQTEPHDLSRLLFHHLLLEGVYLQEGFPAYMTLAHDDEALEHVVAGFGRALSAMVDGDFFPRGKLAKAAAPPPLAKEPPVPGARLGRDPQGRPAWFVPDPARRGAYLQVTER
ncbi:MAG: aminotransferase class III-fold pyridoxal phosphate-dependent enzyme [Deltaproteobacteria bacterium]|nr:aminotransferase class III-fold pyridoxal phosphate-dependent enzyme [Deltaproteobacteria bacterium]MCB9788869.1 aminotransferase class III-fold pyridoxal phosphate-dependent enzyme [Deltaproteobacteria bacterium]